MKQSMKAAQVSQLFTQDDLTVVYLGQFGQKKATPLWLETTCGYCLIDQEVNHSL